jgi:hypothetical protein
VKLGNALLRQNLKVDVSGIRGVALKLADELYRLGLFVGTGNDANNNPVYELERPLTRIEAVSLILRLLGLDGDAAAYTGRNPFQDVPAWAQKEAAYAYNAGLVYGVNDSHTILDANRAITSKEFTAILLRVLGYQESKGDFIYDLAPQKSIDVSLFTSSEVQAWSSASTYLRSDVVVGLTDLLTTYQRQPSNQLFIYSLVDKGKFTNQLANLFISNATGIYKH